MNLYEYQVKEILAQRGLSVPRGKIVADSNGIQQAVAEIGAPCMVKAQVLAGGRGKAGAVLKAATQEEAILAAKSLLGRTVKGLTVRKILVEEQVNIEQEFYAGVTADRKSESPLIILSSVGGMDIEEVAATQPNQVLRKTVDIAYGFHPFEARKMAFVTGLKAKTAQQLAEILLALYNLYWEKDAELVEINPLVLTGSGSWVCVDGKMNIDNNALFRHPDLKALREDTLETRLAEGGPRERLIYVPLEGNIGIMGTGAGMTMATMDQVIAAGGRPASFIDCGSSMRYVGPEKGIKLLKEKGVDVILISTYTGGRSQMAAKRICEVLESMPDFEIPVVVRLQGKNEGEAIETLSSCKHPALKVAKDPDEAVRIAVAIARERERK